MSEARLFIVTLPDRGAVMVETDDDRGWRDQDLLERLGLPAVLIAGPPMDPAELPCPYYPTLDALLAEYEIGIRR